MRKRLVVLGMLLAFCLSATASAAAFKERYVFAAQEAGSTILVLTTAITGALEKYLPEGVKVDINPTGGTVASCSMVQNGRADFGWAEVSALWALEGKILFNTPHDKLRSVAGGAQTSFAQAWMSKSWADKYGIRTFADIAAKKPPMRIFTKKRGMMGQAGAPLQLEAYGITYADVESWGGRIVESGLTEIVDALRDNMGDVWLDMHPIGQATAMELTQTTDTLILQHTPEGLDYLTKYGFSKGLVPAGSWKNQDGDVWQPMASTILTVSSDVSDEFVYLVAKAICENADVVRNSFAGAKGFDEKLAGTPERAIIPLHPGAARYYREVGFIK